MTAATRIAIPDRHKLACLSNPDGEVSQRAVRITRRAKIDGLLGAEEAVRLQLVTGAGFEPAALGFYR
jgi:hypothetical protein